MDRIERGLHAACFFAAGLALGAAAGACLSGPPAPRLDALIARDALERNIRAGIYAEPPGEEVPCGPEPVRQGAGKKEVR